MGNGRAVAQRGGRSPAQPISNELDSSHAALTFSSPCEPGRILLVREALELVDLARHHVAVDHRVDRRLGRELRRGKRGSGVWPRVECKAARGRVRGYTVRGCASVKW